MKHVILLTVAALLGAFSVTAKIGNTIIDADDSATTIVKKEAHEIRTLCSAMRMRFTNDDSDLIYSYASADISITYTEGQITCKLGDVSYELYDTSSSSTGSNYLYIKEVSSKEISYYGEFTEEDDQAYFQANKIKDHDVEDFLQKMETLKAVLKKMLETTNDLASS